MAKKTVDDSPLSILDMVQGELIEDIKPSNLVHSLEDNVIEPSKFKANDTVEDDAELNDIEADLTTDDVDTSDEEPKEDIKSEEKEVPAEDTTEPDAEASQVELFFDAFAEHLEWGELEEGEEKPKTIEAFIEYIQNLVEDEATPQYGNDLVAELDAYVKNGGDFVEFYKMQQGLTDLDNVDLTVESNQKSIVREYLKMIGNDDSQINKKIQRWEDAGTLEEEAEDVLETLKTIKTQEKENALKEQERIKQQNEDNYRQFYNDTIKSIEEMSEVRGIKIPAEDRKKLKDYAFKVEADGTTRFQKDYAKNVSRNFIESAYFTMKGDALITTAKKAGESSAVEKLRHSLKNKAVSNKSKNTIENKSASSIWSAASSVLMNS